MDEKNETKYKLVPRMAGGYDFLVRVKASSFIESDPDYVWETPDGGPSIVTDEAAAKKLIANLNRDEIQLSNDPSPNTSIKEDIRQEIDNAAGPITKVFNQTILIGACENSRDLFKHLAKMIANRNFPTDTHDLVVAIELIDDILAKVKSNDNIS